MVQSQLGSVELNSLLDVDGQVQALKLELEEVKQADDEEIDRLLDQNGNMLFMFCAHQCILIHLLASLQTQITDAAGYVRVLPALS